MKKFLISIVLLAAILLSLLTGCDSQDNALLEEEALSIVYQHAGVDKSAVIDPHLHVLVEDGVAVYNIHFTANNISYDYTINSRTGEILSAEP